MELQPLTIVAPKIQISEIFPALELIMSHHAIDEYHWRWEVENTLSEFKTHLNARKTRIRSKKPKLVVQEIYGWLLAHARSTVFDFSCFYYY